MDGTMSITDQVRLMRSVMGRKIMELDEYNDKAAEAGGDEAERYLAMADFLENDIAGYKTIIEDLKDGSCDYTGSIYDIASLPAELLGLYQNFYIPSLSPEDRADENAAMELKVSYAKDLATSYAAKIGKAALSSDLALNLMMSDDGILAAIGAIVASNPEILSALSDEQ